MNSGDLVARLEREVVGRRRELELVEGNAELTPARLVGTFDPARVLAQGYDPEVFVDGPLLAAMRQGSLLYVEEINRIPEETLNVLITVMSEGEVHIPRLGAVAAADGFRLVAAMNPFDAIGTARISSAVYDRVCRLSVGYQSASEECEIVERAVGDRLAGVAVDGRWLECAVELADLRNRAVESPEVCLDAALVALSGRIRLHEGSVRTPEEIVTELWRDVFSAPPTEGDDPSRSESDGSGKVQAP
jgi:MoxR-like ATPase